MNRLEFKRQNGNLPKTLPGKDHISGLLWYHEDALPSGFSATDCIKLISSIETAEDLGITSDADTWQIRNLHYQLSQIFRTNPGITLYVGIFTKPTSHTYTEVKTMQNFAGGDIRQIGVYPCTAGFSASDLTALQGVADQLEAEDTPLSILFAPMFESVSGLPDNLAGANKKNVSVVIGQDGEGVAKELHEDTGRGSLNVSAIGVALGLVSKAAVHECIGWVQKFPSGISLPAFADGTPYRTLDKGIIETLDNARYIFFRTYSGLADSYANDSHNMDAATSDYNTIESVRTMDKAVRGIRTCLLPELGGPLYIDPETGKLSPETVKRLETVANLQLEDMEKAGELSGYIVEIDPDQNVLASSEVQFVVKNVPVGVFRTGIVKIGYTQSTN